ncbi:MAG: methyltransferase [Acutalibacteraceae bacterium]|nr:methyltransferase [Acutalibacteraceae bacterium]
MDKFKLENLGSGITAVISKEHGFGTDALLLADFAAVKESNRCCDMGSGSGIIPLLWLKKNMSRPVAAIEISEQGCEQMNKAAEVNSLGGRLEVYNKDLRNVREFLPAGEFDVVTMNPPYKAEGAGIVSADETAARARQGCAARSRICAKPPRGF